ncbi:MAG TPA: FHA domain-containing protein [Bacillota bacterium]|nr:FHA domain-containing protein [Bacillota bacterium]HOL09452.1 FHA domain-containing protein [Bacillota bacterium]HPO97674.1 FHA domain-containing protein [Bacillota bacterium]
MPNSKIEDNHLEKTLPRIRQFKAETANSDHRLEKTITKRLKRSSQSKLLKEQWVITVVSGQDKGRQYLATTSQLKIGRKSDNHIYLRDPKVSRYHALLKLKGSKWYIKDLQSTNGTRVNNQKIVGEKELAPGVQITIGDTIIEIKKIDS